MQSPLSRSSTPDRVRRAAAILTAVLVTFVGFAGGHDGATASMSAPHDAASVPVMQHDLDGLAQLVHLPPSAQDAHFIVRPVGEGGALADGFVLEAWLEVSPDGWDAVEATWGAPTVHPQAGHIQRGHAESMVPSDVRQGLEIDATGDFVTRGLHYGTSGLGRYPWRVLQVVRVADRGVLITAEHL